MIYPEVESRPVVELEQLVNDLSSGQQPRLTLRGEKMNGDEFTLVVSLAAGKKAPAEVRLPAMNFGIRNEDGRIFIDNVAFNSPAQKTGIDWDQEFVSIQSLTDRPRKQWKFIRRCHCSPWSGCRRNDESGVLPGHRSTAPRRRSAETLCPDDQRNDMIKKILVHSVFSKFTERLLRFAVEIAGACGAELQLINVINERDLEAVQKITAFGYKVDTKHSLQTLIQERREEMARLLAKVGLNGDGVPFHFEVGNPAEKLLQLVVKENIDAVVKGVKNRDVSTLFTGSVAERFFHRCPVTVISYRDPGIATHLRKRVLKHLQG